eukprot:4475949-Pleurochrysis_carterae.AAC.1
MEYAKAYAGPGARCWAQPHTRAHTTDTQRTRRHGNVCRTARQHGGSHRHARGFCLLYTSDAADDTPCVDLG